MPPKLESRAQKSNSAMPLSGRSGDAEVPQERNNGHQPGKPLNTQEYAQDQLSRKISDNSNVTSGQTMLDTFSRVMSVKCPNDGNQRVQQARTIRKKFQQAMMNNDQAINQHFHPRSMSQNQVKSNSQVGRHNGNGANDNTRIITDIYKDLRHSFDFVLKQQTKSNINRRNASLLMNNLMSLEGIMSIETPEAQ